MRNSHDIIGIEDALLPMGLLVHGASGEDNRLVAGREGNIKEADNSVDVVVTEGGELVGNLRMW